MSSERNLSNLNFFICSTYVDLRAYRDAVIKNIQSQAGVINAQEFFGARDQKPLTTCLEELNDADVFVMFLGPRYGSVDPDSGISFVEHEYKRATELKLPRFAYIMDQSHSFPIEFVSTGEDAEKLKAFRERVQKDLTVDFFTTPEDLATKVFADLKRELPKRGFILGEQDDSASELSPALLIRKFLALPQMFQGRELSFRATLGTYSRASESECEAFSFTYGATVGRRFTAVEAEIKRELGSKLNEVFASHDDALALIEIPENKEVTLTLKTVQGRYQRRTAIYDDKFTGTMFGASKVVVGHDATYHLACGLELIDVRNVES